MELNMARNIIYYSHLQDQIKESWTPSDISTYSWYDASDSTTITHVAGAVSQWSDKSGNLRHATQGTGSLQPTTGTRTINGLNAMNFDPTEYLNLSSFNFMGKECYAVFEMDALDDFEVLGASSNTQVSAWTQNGTVNPPRLRLWAGNIYTADTKSTSTLPINQVHMAGWLAHSPKQYSVNGTWENKTDTPTGSACTVNAIMRNQYNDGQDGIIGEIIVMDGVSGTEKRQKIEGYLAWKWGLVSKLPSNHPYKLAPPTG